MAFVLAAVVKVTLVCGTAFLCSHLFRRSRAAMLHLFFAMTFVALVLIPVGTIMLPPVALPIPAPEPRSEAHVATADGLVGFTTAVRLSRGATPHTVAISASARRIIPPVMAGIWLSGAAIFCIPIMAGLWQMRRLRCNALPWPEGDEAAQHSAGTLGVHRRVEVLRHEAVQVPLTYGCFRPVILFPDDVEHWDVAALQRSLTHELEHVARCDWLTHLLARLVCSGYWFHPLAWAAWRRMRFEADRACDDAVLKQSDPGDYAALLVAMAQREPSGLRRPLLAMAGRGDLAARVTAVLDAGQVRGRIGHLRTTAVVLVGVVAILTLAPLTVARIIAQAQVTRATNPALRFESVSIKRSTAVDAPLVRLSDMGLTGTNVTVRSLLTLAYGPPNGIRWPYPIEYAPAWIDSDRFDIVATAPPGSARGQIGEMLRALLADRFKLTAQVESKEFPVYALVPAWPGGVPEWRLTPSATDCKLKPSDCSLSGMRGHLEGRGLTMSALAATLVSQLGGSNQIRFDRPVIDRTNLSGSFDFTLDWTPDPVAMAIVAPSEASRLARESTARNFSEVIREHREIVWPTDAARWLSEFKPYAFSLESAAPNFLAALREQLSLSLESQLAPQLVLSIDRIEPPTED